MAWEGAWPRKGPPFTPLHWPVPVTWPHGARKGWKERALCTLQGKEMGCWQCLPRSASLDTVRFISSSSQTESKVSLSLEGENPKSHRPCASRCLGWGVTSSTWKAPKTQRLP